MVSFSKSDIMSADVAAQPVETGVIRRGYRVISFAWSNFFLIKRNIIFIYKSININNK